MVDIIKQGNEKRYTTDDLAWLIGLFIKKLEDVNPCQEYLNVKDVSELLGLSEVTVRKHIREGKLKAYRPGYKYLIPSSSIGDYLENYRVR